MEAALKEEIASLKNKLELAEKELRETRFALKILRESHPGQATFELPGWKAHTGNEMKLCLLLLLLSNHLLSFHLWQYPKKGFQMNGHARDADFLIGCQSKEI